MVVPGLLQLFIEDAGQPFRGDNQFCWIVTGGSRSCEWEREGQGGQDLKTFSPAIELISSRRALSSS